jgi:adenine-specific DNA-methyltransferase
MWGFVMISDVPQCGLNSRRYLSDRIDIERLRQSEQLASEHKAAFGQFFTPADTARFMASWFVQPRRHIRLLDAGAGIGSLTAAFVESRIQHTADDPALPPRLAVEEREPWHTAPVYELPATIHATLYEKDAALLPSLSRTLGYCAQYCERYGVHFEYDLRNEDFIVAASEDLQLALYRDAGLGYDCAILNPPYGKIRSDSDSRFLLRRVGIETSNLYTAFVALTVDLLKPNGELVAITPRSFCNGPYFRPFRRHLLRQMSFRRIHVFDSRDRAFQDDDVLQENIIFYAVKAEPTDSVLVSSSSDPLDPTITVRQVDHEMIVSKSDPDLIVNITTTDTQQSVVEHLSAFRASLGHLGISVSTGRVVDFRAKAFLLQEAANGSVPLIYPHNFQASYVRWPKRHHKKAVAVVRCPETEPLFLPAGVYVLVKRFTSKEEKRRITAALYDPALVAGDVVAFENHLNVFHSHNRGLPIAAARGLCVYLNSTLLDIYFRQFSGHTQVNASDLRLLPYPNLEVLERLGHGIGDEFPDQEEIDRRVEQELHLSGSLNSLTTLMTIQKVAEALDILKQLGLPKGQQNERSALVLLALLDLKPETPWHGATANQIGVTPIMDFIRTYYGKDYAPNTRETIRRQTLHQFVAAGLVEDNPDAPDLPVNSPKYSYRVTQEALALLSTFGTEGWVENVSTYLTAAETLVDRYARRRQMAMIPVRFGAGQEAYFRDMSHNRLIQAIITDFAERFAPGAYVVYVGATESKAALFDREYLQSLGVKVDLHGKMPDVILHDTVKDWLLLIESVTSHGPVDGKRREELAHVFAAARPGIVYVTAFPNRSDFVRNAASIAWATEVWIADSPTHLIHFDGERFLGPYEP